MKNSWKDGNTRPSYLSTEKHVAHEATVRTSPWDNGLVQNWERSMSRLYKCHPAYLTLCRVHPVKCQAGWITSRNQDCWEKYQQPQMCRWYHPNGESKEELKNLLIKVKEWKSWLKTQHSKNQDHGFWSHHFMANRWGEKWKQWETLFSCAPKSLWIVTATWN